MFGSSAATLIGLVAWATGAAAAAFGGYVDPVRAQIHFVDQHGIVRDDVRERPFSEARGGSRGGEKAQLPVGLGLGRGDRPRHVPTCRACIRLVRRRCRSAVT